jgi:energy-coupling factor transporter ATP-binding protein EcfA2
MAERKPPAAPTAGAVPTMEVGEGAYKGVARLLLKVHAFSGEVELELQGDAVTLRFNGLEAGGALPQLRALCERVGLLEKDYFALKEELRKLGLKVPEPPVPVDLAKIFPACTPLEMLELLGTLPRGDLGLSALLERAELEGWVSAEDSLNPKKLLSKVPSHVRARLAAQLLEEWDLVRIVALRLAPAGEERATGEAYEGRCAPVGDRVLLPLEVWESAASRFFASALNHETLSYVRNHPTAVPSHEVPLERVNPWHLLRLKGWVLDLRDLKLVPPSLCDWWFTYQVDMGLRDAELRLLVERVRRGEYDIRENAVYRLWKPHFDAAGGEGDGSAGEREWGYFVDAVGTWFAPHRFRLVALLVGERGSGKSSLLAALTAPIEPLVGRVPLSKLASKERFALQPLIGKWVNVYSERLAPTVSNLEAINNLVGESDWVYVDRKHKPPVFIRSLKSMVFAGNAVPMVTSWEAGVMDAFIDRLSVIFVGKPEDFKPVKDIAEKVPKAESFAFLLWCRRQLEQSEGREREWELRRRSAEELLELLLEAQSPVYRFIAERCAKDPQARVERKELYAAYVEWLKEQGVTAVLSRDQFYMQIRSMGFVDRPWKGEYCFFGLRLAEEGEEGRKQALLLEEAGRFAESA